MRRHLLALSRAGATVWRNNTGLAWAGDVQKITRRQTVAVQPGDVVIRAARPFHGGLCNGSSDIIGITPVTVQPHHVGATLGLFTAVESKSGTGRAGPAQRNFIHHVNAQGGLAGVAVSDDDAIAIIRRHIPPDSG